MLSDKPKFKNPVFEGTAEAEATIQRNDPKEISHISIAVTLYAPSLDWPQSICICLAAQSDPVVRGNAILGFGHLARRFGCLDKNTVLPLVEAALRDSHQYVRGQAVSAADDITHYLHWTIDTNE